MACAEIQVWRGCRKADDLRSEVCVRKRGSMKTLQKFGGLAAILLLSSCSAVDGKWPSLMTPAERAVAGKAAGLPQPAQPAGDPAFASVPVIGATPAVAPVPVMPAALQPLAARLEQEQRASAFAIERLADQRAAAAAAATAAQGQPATMPAAKAAAAAARRLAGLKLDLADQQASLLRVLAEVAKQPISPQRTQLVREAGQQLRALDAVLAAEGIAPAAAGPAAAMADFAQAKAQWQTQAQTLRKSLASVRVRTPADPAWNTAQIELTRVSQTAKRFLAAEQAVQLQAGGLARAAAGGGDVASGISELGDQLSEIALADRDNAQLVADARRQLEGL